MRLMSFCTRPMVAANMQVVAPMKVTKAEASCDSENSGDSRATMNTPAVTMVAAWIKRRDRRRAFHGVGQPGVQQELRRFAHRAHEQAEGTPRSAR